MSVKFETNDYIGRKVLCSAPTWEKHIIEGHAIMARNEAAVAETIQNPDCVYESAQNSKREVFFKDSSRSTYQGLITKAIVEYNDSQEGTLVTAFPIKTIKGGIGNVLYERSDEL